MTLPLVKPTLLFLSHRIPFPPNKGDKIRSYHLLKYLSEHYRVFLGTFIDDENDWQYVSTVEQFCEGSCFVKLHPGLARLKSARGLLTGSPLSLPYYQSRKLSKWVDNQIKQQKISRAVVYSSPMAQYVMGNADSSMTRVVDFVDIDSDKWNQYADRKGWPLNWVYRREARTLLKVEKTVAEKFDASLFVSSTEADMFRSLAPGLANVGFYNNGVDTDYFSPDEEMPNPYSQADKVLVFTGAMDYWPNIDAVIWFVKSIFPGIRERSPDVKFYIVGSKPPGSVQQLAEEANVYVTGRVEDIRPYLKFAVAAVAPMRIARGIQNKVLEAMAMQKPTIVTNQGLEGIAANPGEEVLLANTETDIEKLVFKVLSEDLSLLGEQARARVIQDFNWQENLPIVGQILEHPQ